MFLIYDSPAESPFTSDIIIWSGKDTISYEQGFKELKSGKSERIIIYLPFVRKPDIPKGFSVVTERDSLLTLVSQKKFDTINHLGDNQSINDGNFISIYLAYKDSGQYKIKAYHPKKFMIRDIFIRL